MALVYVEAVIRLGRWFAHTLAGNELFAAHNQYNLAAIVAEGEAGGIGDAAYYSTPLVMTDKCGDWKFDKETLKVRLLCG